MQLAEPPLQPGPALASCSLRPSLPSVGGPEGGSLCPQPDGRLDQALLWDPPLFQPADLPRSEKTNPCVQQPDLSVTHVSGDLLPLFLGVSHACGEAGWDSNVPRSLVRN